MSLAIKVENLSKAYQLGQIGTGTLSRDLERWIAKVRGKEDPFLKVGEVNDRTSKGTSDIVWSLKDIEFDIKQGDAVGIIGRNGAGKSTLLKILSRITSPTSGEINIKGRIASLLEVGTGFHPELTGRENIFLNGAILGMRKKEIKNKFDEIVDFAGIERYIDTPVKRYSSGMYVRLAFAVAAYLESEILIVDEVLAVGDAEFQKKCLGKMGEVSKGEGRTVLFVSHNMGSINSLCQKTIVLQNGSVVFNGGAEQGVDFYMNSLTKNVDLNRIIKKDGLINYINSVGTVDKFKKAKNEYGSNESIFLNLEVKISGYNPSIELGLALMDKRNNRVFTIHEPCFGNFMSKDDRSKELQIEIPKGFLAPGQYSWIATIHIPNQQQFHLLENIAGFQIVDTGTVFSNYNGHDLGVVMPRYTINTK